MSDLKFYKWGDKWGIADASPFCLKIETVLRAANIKYEAPKDCLQNHQNSPKGKLPYIEHNGKLIADSNLIIEYLKKHFDINLDDELTEEEKSISLAFRRMIDENLYWVLLYSRLADETGWNIIKNDYYIMIPSDMRSNVADDCRKNVLSDLKSHGMGRHTADEIYSIGDKDFQALSIFLGNNKFFFNKDKPSLLDICCYSIVGNLIYSPLNTKINVIIKKYDNLLNHCHMIHERYYPEYKNNSL